MRITENGCQVISIAVISTLLFLDITVALPPREDSRRHIASGGCKCAPQQGCWPSLGEWETLNSTISGKLISTEPVAISCYPGPKQDLTKCATIDAQWTNSTFQADQPLGLDYPLNSTCPPVNYTAGAIPNSCSIGYNPVYAINATTSDDVAAGLVFAAKHNIRVVVKTTGHDLNGRSEGYGSLQIWLRHLRLGVDFQSQYKPTLACSSSKWTGSAFKINGGYTWGDVYPLAQANNVIVVGGGTPSVSCIGGWMQGGGHGPASRQFGLGADQVLEAHVILANGSMVTVSPCQNPDLYFAIRGGGPGTYGVVVSTTVKAWPNVDSIAVQHLAIAPWADNTSALLDAVSILFSAFPDLNNAGYAGYGAWAIESPTPFFANYTAGYVHGIYMFDRSIEEAQTAFASTRKSLQPYNNTIGLFISESYVSYPDYWTFYWNESAVFPPVGTSSALGSRLFDRDHFFNSVEVVSGGQVFKDADDPYSGLLPAWRTSYFSNIVSRGWPADANETVRDAVRTDISINKVGAMEQLAPNTGVYMNEGDRLDPDFEKNFYGVNYPILRKIKAVYDPEDLFYCPTCVGSAEWTIKDDGTLCQT